MNTAEAISQAISNKKEAQALKVQPMYDILNAFIKKHKLLLYGGSAINYLMPPEMKIYKAQDNPDYDVFSVSAKEHAYELADTFVKKGYTYTEVKPGLHKGTYKVFVDFFPIVDITEISVGLIKRFHKLSGKVPTVPIEFLKMSIHLELSRPAGHIERWQKLYPRLKSLYKLDVDTPITACKPSSKGVEIATRIIEKVVTKDSKCMLTGLSAVGFYTEGSGGTPVEILAEDVRGCAADVVGVIGGVATIVQTQGNEVVPLCLSVIVGKEVVCKVFELNSCVACRNFGGTLVISYDGLLAHLYGCLLNEENHALRCSITSLIKVPPKPRDRFPETCIGKQETMYSLKKKMWEAKGPVSVYRPVNQKKFLNIKA